MQLFRIHQSLDVRACGSALAQRRAASDRAGSGCGMEASSELGVNE